MNIFILDPDPHWAAEFHCDQHLNKMILESAQMLSTVAHIRGISPRELHFAYRPTHANHPCTKWLNADNWHIIWLLDLCESLDYIRQSTNACAEHASMPIVRELAKMLARDQWDIWNQINEGGDGIDWQFYVHEFALAMPEQFKDQDTPKTAWHKYREYYNHKNKQWGGTMTWKNRTRPFWAE
jgi:hypothetical protein